MASYHCERCETITDSPIEIPYREHYAMGDALVPHDFVELRCQCGGEINEVVACKSCNAARCAPGFDDCEACVAAFYIANPDEFDSFARIFAGKRALEEVQSWITREFRKELVCGRAA